jgi:hypothetical protein
MTATAQEILNSNNFAKASDGLKPSDASLITGIIP